MAQLDEFTLSVPNIPADEVPDGKDENDNVEISRWGGSYIQYGQWLV